MSCGVCSLYYCVICKYCGGCTHTSVTYLVKKTVHWSGLALWWNGIPCPKLTSRRECSCPLSAMRPFSFIFSLILPRPFIDWAMNAQKFEAFQLYKWQSQVVRPGPCNPKTGFVSIYNMLVPSIHFPCVIQKSLWLLWVARPMCMTQTG